MLRKFFVAAALMLLPAAAANAQFQAGDWELTLGGSGSNGPDFNGTSWAVNGSIGHFLTKEFELGVRQAIGYTDLAGVDGSAWNGSTRIFADYHFDMDRWQPYIGAFIGYIYGDVAEESWVAGPEIGVKYFVNSTTFIDVNGAYAFNLEEGLDEGSFFYQLGIGFRW